MTLDFEDVLPMLREYACRDNPLAIGIKVLFIWVLQSSIADMTTAGAAEEPLALCIGVFVARKVGHRRRRNKLRANAFREWRVENAGCTMSIPTDAAMAKMH